MKQMPQFLCVVCMLALPAMAQQTEGSIAPLPVPPPAMDAIKQSATTEDSMLTTRDEAPVKPASPFERVDARPAGPAASASGAAAVGKYSPTIPFGRAEPAAPIIPEGPRATVAVPVVDVDAIEASEAAPPTPVEQGADPVQEDPAEPTELTSPIFEEEVGALSPRKIVLRALNKVTAQSESITLKPNEMVKFGQLQITAITCQTSAERSQTDYAALLDIVEKLPTGDGTKPIFRGWMYASSPSITALEHPVYDVTMVECKTMPRAGKEGKPVEVKDGEESPKAKEKQVESKEKEPVGKPKL